MMVLPLELCLKLWVWQVDGKSISKTSTVELVDDIYDGQFVVAV